MRRGRGGEGQLALAFERDATAEADAPGAAAAPRPLDAREARRRRALLDVRTIYHEPGVAEFARGREILARFPDAARIQVPSHWRIPALHGNRDLADNWVRVKRDVLVLGVRKTLACRLNGRSADFIAPGAANGCAMACAYCYVPRRKGFANPISTFVNIEQIVGYLERHARRQGPKREPNQVDPTHWVYDLGENSDLSVDALVSDNVRDLVALWRRVPHAKGSFATKFVNRDLLGYDPQGQTRLRMSLMPARVARLVDVRTTPIAERLAALDDFVRAGYEVHVNFSPVIVYDGWLDDWAELLDQLDAALPEAARRQLAAEVIFLTHNAELHEVNLAWHPQAEALLWTPEWQETKTSEHGGTNVRYRAGMKRRLVDELLALIARRLPYCRVRYAF